MTKQPKSSTPKKKKMGRPSLGEHAARPHTIRFTPKLTTKIKHWGQQRGITGLSEIVRALITKALKTKD